MTWETVIGLEVHVQLRHATKMFCGCANSFGAPPNTNWSARSASACPARCRCPTPRRSGWRRARRWRSAARCITRSIFARKNYFYPDLPKGYQISQFDQPLATGGAVAVRVARAGPHQRSGSPGCTSRRTPASRCTTGFPGKTAVDLNRAGVPLAEIVSEPDLRSPAEARAYLTALKQLLVYAGVSDCNMEKGSLRVDANVSIRRPGDPSSAPRPRSRT